MHDTTRRAARAPASGGMPDAARAPGKSGAPAESGEPGEPDDPARAYFEACRARVDGFVDGHFGFFGSLKLHRAAAGLDVLRAPANVLLAPLHVAISLLALAAGGLRLRRLSAWLRRRDILFTTDVGREVERLIARELLDLPPVSGAAGRGSHAADPLTRSMRAAAPLREDARRTSDPAELARLDALADRMARSVRDYAGTRGAVAEATTAIATLIAGALIFNSFTPGAVSMAPAIAETLSRDAAISGFPFGTTLGGVWYGVFPTDTPAWLFASTLAALMLFGAVFAAFSGVLADPLQKRLGIHRRRLTRLLDALEADVRGTLSSGFSAREHYYARLFDLVDAGVSVLRIFRG